MAKTRLRPWFRLGLVLSGVYVIGMSIYAALSLNDPYDVRSPFVLLRHNGAVFNVGLFAVVVFGGAAGIWLMAIGPAWVVSGFRDPGDTQSPPTSLQPIEPPASENERSGI